MTPAANEPIHGKLRMAGIFMLLGLIAVIASLAWEKPLAFILFVGAGGSLTLIGLLLYLYSLVSSQSSS